ncbi:MAG: T9SS type A sorting domain-containing protein [Bacteroidota bacterium]
MFTNNLSHLRILVSSFLLSCLILGGSTLFAQDAPGDAPTGFDSSGPSGPTRSVGRSANGSSSRFFASQGGDFDRYLFRSNVSGGRASYPVEIDKFCYDQLEFNGQGFMTNADELIEKGVIPKEAQLSLRVFDVDHNAQFDGNNDGRPDPEVDYVYVNGNLVTNKDGSPWTLTSGNNTWSTPSINIPIEYLKFPQAGGSGSVTNIIEIEIDVPGTGYWAVTCDWVLIDITDPEMVYPICLVHGWNGNNTTFNEFEEFFEEDGIPSFSVQLLGQGSIEQNAILLNAEIENYLATSCYDKVNILAHSKGGLDSRAYLRRFGGSKVGTFVQLGTPNHGSILADAVLTILTHGNFVQRAAVANAVGTNLNDNALRNLTTPFIETQFNYAYYQVANNLLIVPRYTEAFSGVDAHIYAGTEEGALFSVANWYANHFGFFLEEPSDGIVSVASASLPWNCSDSYLDGVLNCASVDGQVPFNHTDIKEERATYDLIKPIFESKGKVARRSSPLVPGGRPTGDSLDIFFDELITLDNTAPQEIQISTPTNTVFRLAASILEADMSLALEDGLGNTFDTNSPELTKEVSSIGTQFIFLSETGITGPLKLTLSTTETTSVQASVTAKAKSAFQLDITDLTASKQNNSLNIVAEFSEGGILTAGATLTAQVRENDSSSFSFPLFDDGQHGDGVANDGIYGNSLAQAFSSDFLAVEVSASYQGFSLYERTSVAYGVQMGTFADTYQETTVDEDNDRLIDGLAITVGLNIQDELRGIVVTGKLVDASGDFIVTATLNETQTQTGPLNVVLSFGGEEIAQKGLDGPYTLSDLQLIDLETGEVVDERQTAYTTSAYLATQFERENIVLTGQINEAAVDKNFNGLYDSLNVAVEVDVLTPGFYNISAQLVDSTLSSINWTTNNLNLSQGKNTIYLRFEGKEINRDRLSGSYTVTNLSLYNDQLQSYNYFYNVYTTNSYQFSEFEGETLSGLVETTGGAPIQGVEILLGGQRLATTTTNAQGEFFFSGLTPGNYTVRPADLPNCAPNPVSVRLPQASPVVIRCQAVLENPSGLIADNGTAFIVPLSWSDNSNSETGFELWRDGNLLATLPANTTSFTDTVLVFGQVVSYQVRAFDGQGTSDFTNAATYQMPTSFQDITVTYDCYDGNKSLLYWEINNPNAQSHPVIWAQWWSTQRDTVYALPGISSFSTIANPGSGQFGYDDNVTGIWYPIENAGTGVDIVFNAPLSQDCGPGKRGTTEAPKAGTIFGGMLNVNSTFDALVDLSSQFTVRPNPVKDVLFIHNKGWETKADVLIRNIVGQTVARNSMEFTPGGASQIDISTLPKGLYILEIKVNGASISYKVLKE